jgi:hypothetical protein
VPSVTRLATMSCSVLFFGNARRVDVLGGSAMAAHSSHSSSSSLRTTICRLGARSRIALINVSCCSSGLKQSMWSSLSTKFLEQRKSRSHSGLVLLWTGHGMCTCSISHGSNTCIWIRNHKKNTWVIHIFSITSLV